jgi:hypothetical protein
MPSFHPAPDVEKALLLSEAAKDLSPKVRGLAAVALRTELDRLCDDEADLSYHVLLDIRGSIRGVLAFSRELDRAIKSGSIHEKEEA